MCTSQYLGIFNYFVKLYLHLKWCVDNNNNNMLCLQYRHRYSTWSTISIQFYGERSRMRSSFPLCLADGCADRALDPMVSLKSPLNPKLTIELEKNAIPARLHCWYSRHSDNNNMGITKFTPIHVGDVIYIDIMPGLKV